MFITDKKENKIYTKEGLKIKNAIIKKINCKLIIVFAYSVSRKQLLLKFLALLQFIFLETYYIFIAIRFFINVLQI